MSDQYTKISIVYATYRKNPYLDWLIDSFYNQCIKYDIPTSVIQFIIVDSYLWQDPTNTDERRSNINKWINNRFDYVHVSPKPNPYQGPNKLTSIDYFSAGNARNTGICYAKHSYVLFIDDLSILGEGCLVKILDGASAGLVIGYAYKKLFDIEIESGNIISKTEIQSGIDSRWHLGNNETIVIIRGSQLYGYCGMPLQVILDVNGYDQICDSIRGEDYHLGIRIEKMNIPIYYNINVVFYEADGEKYVSHPYIARNSVLSKEKYESILTKYNITQRWHDKGGYDISFLVLDILLNASHVAKGNKFNLADLRNKILAGGTFEIDFDSTFKTIEDLNICDI